MHRAAHFCAIALTVPSAVSMLTMGCYPFIPSESVGGVLGAQAEAIATNNTNNSTPVNFDANGRAILYGILDSDSDIDSWDLGLCSPGDTFTLEFSQGGGLDSCAALFDAEARLMMLNDNSYGYADPSAPRVYLVARWFTDHLYLNVATSPRNVSSGDYNVSLARSASAAPVPQPAVVVLDWNGASGVSVGGGTPIDVPPFQGSLIDHKYADSTQQLIDKTLAMVRQDYAGLNVTFYLDGDPSVPRVPHSTVYFGTYNATLLGLADSVDYYNATPQQNAIIFTDTFALFMALDPSVDEMAQCLANVTSHEVGHLLGLNHTQDPTSIMDITATAYQMLFDEAFLQAPLHDAVFPTGSQNAISLLVNTVGGTADPNAARLVKDPHAAALKDPVEAQRAIIGSFQVRKDFFCAHQCGHDHEAE